MLNHGTDPHFVCMTFVLTATVTLVTNDKLRESSIRNTFFFSLVSFQMSRKQHELLLRNAMLLRLHQSQGWCDHMGDH